MYMRTRRIRGAEEKIATAESLLEERKLADAYEAAMLASAVLPGNDRLRDIIARTSDQLTIDSDPPGASVYLQRFKGPPERVRMGVTPLTIPRIARADYLLTLEKAGYAPGVRPISTLPAMVQGEWIALQAPAVRMKLAEGSKAPPGMVLVEGGTYRL